MYEDLRKKAEKKVEAKKAFYIVAIVFAFTSVLLIMMSFYLTEIGFWLRLPIPAFVMVLAILYITAFGMPTRDGIAENWEEEEIEKEMLKLYQKRKVALPSDEKLTETEILELKELERLERKWRYADDEDYV